MDRIQCRNEFEDFLEKIFWNSGGLKLLAACIPLAVVFFLLQNVAEVAFDWMATGAGIPNGLEDIKEVQAGVSWISPLIFAPIFENLLCLFWVRILSPHWGRSWWLVPLVVALIAGAFHVLVYMEIRYASIVVNFFAICCLIHNVKNRFSGFMASVFIHALMNLMVMVQLNLTLSANA